MKNLFSLIKENKFSLYLSIILHAIFSAIMPIVGSLFSAAIIDLAVYNKPNALNKVLYSIPLLVLFIIGTPVLEAFQNTQVSRASQKLRNKVTYHVLNLDTREMLSMSSSKIVAATSQDIDNIISFFKNVLPYTFNTIFTVISMVTVISLMNFTILVITLLTAAIYSISIRYSKRIRSYEQTMQDTGEVATDHIIQLASNVPMLHIFKGTAIFAEKTKELFDTITTTRKKVIHVSTLMTVLAYGCNCIRDFAILIVGPLFLGLSLGNTIAISNLCSFLNSIFLSFNHIYVEWQKIAVAFERIQKVLTLPVMPDTPTAEDELVVLDTAPTITFKDLCFGYNDKEILNHVNLTIAPNEAVGVVGEIGSGKSTLIKLLCGLYRPSSGQILFNDQVVSQNDLIRNTAFVDQNTTLFTGTIQENITCFASAVDEQRVKQAITSAGLDVFINNLDKGVNTLVDENFKPSGGEKQRIAIARALYKDAPIIVFDESTSALDNITQEFILETIEKLKGEKTLILIAHRTMALKNVSKLFRFGQAGVTIESCKQ